jgi:hypothetical protein
MAEIVFLLAVVVGAAALIVYLTKRATDSNPPVDIDPAGAGGPRPKPAGTDMEAQAAGGPRPKV